MQTFRALEQTHGALEHLDIILDLANQNLAQAELMQVNKIHLTINASKLRGLAERALEATQALERELYLQDERERAQKNICF